MKYLKLTSFDGTVLQTYLWDEVKQPKGVVQISHGGAEHARRYDDFAKFLNANGYIVFADDHRAHGNSEKKADIGYHEGDIYGDTVKDEVFITKYLSEKYNLPVIYLGHSYGSFLGQSYIQQKNMSVGAVFSGSSRQSRILIAAGSFFSNLITKAAGEKKKGKLMNGFSFGSYNRPFKKEGHQFAWLTRDVEQVKKYCYDEQCGYVMSNNFYNSFMQGIREIYKPDNLAKIDKSKPIAIFSGEKDPTGGKKACNVRKLEAMYKDLGVADVTMKIYPEARHEILNETNNKEVYADILAAVDKMAAKQTTAAHGLSEN